MPIMRTTRMAGRGRALFVCCAFLALLGAFLWFGGLRRPRVEQILHAPPPLAIVRPGPHTSVIQLKRELRSRPRRGTPPTYLNEDELAGLRRDQFRSSAREIQESLASSASTVTFNWINPGPVNPNVQIGGQYTGVSGKLQAFALDPSNPKVMYAGGGTGSGNEGPA